MFCAWLAEFWCFTSLWPERCEDSGVRTCLLSGWFCRERGASPGAPPCRSARRPYPQGCAVSPLQQTSFTYRVGRLPVPGCPVLLCPVVQAREGGFPTNPQTVSVPCLSRSSTLAHVVRGSGEIVSVALEFRWVKQIQPFAFMVLFRRNFPLFTLCIILLVPGAH